MYLKCTTKSKPLGRTLYRRPGLRPERTSALHSPPAWARRRRPPPSCHCHCFPARPAAAPGKNGALTACTGGRRVGCPSPLPPSAHCLSAAPCPSAEQSASPPPPSIPAEATSSTEPESAALRFSGSGLDDLPGVRSSPPPPQNMTEPRATTEPARRPPSSVPPATCAALGNSGCSAATAGATTAPTGVSFGGCRYMITAQ